jgi:hypothetical protein
MTVAGHAWLAGLGLQPAAPSGRRRYACACLDWSERRDHLAGQPLAYLLVQGCLRRGDRRALQLTPTGAQALRPWLALGVGAAGT